MLNHEAKAEDRGQLVTEDGARRRLGRGLAALIGEPTGEAAAAAPRSPPRRLPVAFLNPSPRNPRKSFAGDDLDDLTASVRERGVVQPILVRARPGEPQVYEIIAGERRWRAAQRAGLHDVPVLILEVSDREALELAIIENVQRTDLNPLEEALGYTQLIEEHGYSQAQLAEVIGKSRPHISNTLRLLKLPETVRDHVRSGRLSAGHARALVTLDDPEAAARRIVEVGMSVREVEALANGGRAGTRPPRRAAEKDADTMALERSLSDTLGLAVSIDHHEDRGEVRIKYRSLEQLDEVCRRLRG